MTLQLDAAFIRESGGSSGWVEYGLLRCNFCPVTLPTNGLMDEADVVVVQAYHECGWRRLGPFDACPECAASMYDEARLA